MRSVLLFAAFVASALGQQSSSSSSPSSSSTTSAPAATHTITVGQGGQNAFVPDSVEANVGDTITFQFFPGNHSVAKSQFGYPCIPYEDVGAGRTGWFSGFEPVNIGDVSPTYNITVNDTNPLFFYCTAPNSCIGYGMVGAINPNASTPVATQISLAHQADYMLQPGESFPAEASSSAEALASTATATATVTTSIAPSATATTSTIPSATPASTHKGLGSGAIAGIAIAGVALIALAGALFYFIGRSRTLKSTMESRNNAPESSFYTNASGHHGHGSYQPSGQQTPRHPNDPFGHWSSNLPPYQQYHDAKKGPGGGGGTSQVGVEDVSSLRSTSPPLAGVGPTTPFMGFPFAPQQQPQHSPPLQQGGWVWSEGAGQGQGQGQDQTQTLAQRRERHVSELGGVDLSSEAIQRHTPGMPSVHELDVPLMSADEAARRHDDC